MTHDEKERLAESLAVLEQKDIALRQEILARSTAYCVSLKGFEGCEQEVSERVRRVLEIFLLSRGELFATAISRGEFDHFGFDGLRDLVIRDLSKNRPSSTLDGKIVDAIVSVITEIVLTPGDATEGYLRNLADSYTLMAFLRETPDVQSAVTKMFSYGEIWLDTSVVLPLFAEELIEPERKRFTGMVLAARESGLHLHVTFGVIEEVERHMNRCLTCFRTTSSWKGKLPFLYAYYISSGRPKIAFGQWLERFRGTSRPEDDIADYLYQTYGISRVSLEAEAASAPPELRTAVKEAWISIHERRRSQGVYDIDPIAMLRLAEHDIENYLGVIGRRRGEAIESFLGYKHWFLTLDHTAYDIDKTIKHSINGKAPSSPILSADFMVNYLTFGPVRSRVSKYKDHIPPIVLDLGVIDYLPPELLDLAESVRTEAKDLPEHVIRRRVRDELDNAKRRIGVVAQSRLEDVAKDISHA